MGVLTTVTRWGKGLLIGLFCALFLCALLEINLASRTRDWLQERLSDDEPDLRAIARSYERANADFGRFSGLKQNWEMFSPNAGSWSHVPVIKLCWHDGTHTLLTSVVEPDLAHLAPGADRLPPDGLSDEQRVYRWKVHVGDARIRKAESNILDENHTRAGPTIGRISYTRWRLVGYFREHPQRLERFHHAELWRVFIRHDLGEPPLLESASRLMTYQPQFDRLWPHDLPLPEYVGAPWPWPPGVPFAGGR